MEDKKKNIMAFENSFTYFIPLREIVSSFLQIPVSFERFLKIKITRNNAYVNLSHLVH